MIAAAALEAGVCRHCGCTEDHACEVGCSWTDDTQTLCSICRGAEVLAEMVVRAMAPVADLATPRVPLVSGAWADLDLDRQRLLVMAARSVIDKIAEDIQLDLAEQAVGAFQQLEELGVFLEEKAREEVRIGESLVGMVKRLLDPHLGSRIVLPS